MLSSSSSSSFFSSGNNSLSLCQMINAKNTTPEAIIFKLLALDGFPNEWSSSEAHITALQNIIGNMNVSTRDELVDSLVELNIKLYSLGLLSFTRLHDEQLRFNYSEFIRHGISINTIFQRFIQLWQNADPTSGSQNNIDHWLEHEVSKRTIQSINLGGHSITPPSAQQNETHPHIHV